MKKQILDLSLDRVGGDTRNGGDGAWYHFGGLILFLRLWIISQRCHIFLVCYLLMEMSSSHVISGKHYGPRWAQSLKIASPTGWTIPHSATVGTQCTSH